MANVDSAAKPGFKAANDQPHFSGDKNSTRKLPFRRGKVKAMSWCSSLIRKMPAYMGFALAVACGALNAYNGYTLFENDRYFSHLSTLEREMTFRTEMGLYYSYYKTVAVTEITFASGLARLIANNHTEWPDTINTLRRFNIYPELLLSTAFRLFKAVTVALGIGHSHNVLTCWTVHRGSNGIGSGLAGTGKAALSGSMEPVESCSGLGDAATFYVVSVYLWNALTGFALVRLAAIVSETQVCGPLLTAVLYFANFTEATRIQWTPPLRESFGYPLLLAHTWLTSILLRRCEAQTHLPNEKLETEITVGGVDKFEEFPSVSIEQAKHKDNKASSVACIKGSIPLSASGEAAGQKVRSSFTGNSNEFHLASHTCQTLPIIKNQAFTTPLASRVVASKSSFQDIQKRNVLIDMKNGFRNNRHQCWQNAFNVTLHGMSACKYLYVILTTCCFLCWQFSQFALLVELCSLMVVSVVHDSRLPWFRVKQIAAMQLVALLIAYIMLFANTMLLVSLYGALLIAIVSDELVRDFFVNGFLIIKKCIATSFNVGDGLCGRHRTNYQVYAQILSRTGFLKSMFLMPVTWLRLTGMLVAPSLKASFNEALSVALQKILKIAFICGLAVLVKLLSTALFRISDDGHIWRLLLAKVFPGMYHDFDTMLYTCAPEFDFLRFDYVRALFPTMGAPLCTILLMLFFYLVRSFMANLGGYPESSQSSRQIPLQFQSSAAREQASAIAPDNNPITTDASGETAHHSKQGTQVKKSSFGIKRLTSVDQTETIITRAETETFEGNDMFDKLVSAVTDKNSLDVPLAHLLEGQTPLVDGQQCANGGHFVNNVYCFLPAELLFNLYLCVAFVMMATMMMRLKVFLTPHLCVLASLSVSPRLFSSLFYRRQQPAVSCDLPKKRHLPKRRSSGHVSAWNSDYHSPHKIGHLGLAVALIVVTVGIGWPAFYEMHAHQSEYSNPDLEELLEFISYYTEPEDSFAGPMPLMANVLLSTGRPVVNHPHYENAGLRARTYRVYSLLSRRSLRYVHEQLVGLHARYIVISRGWCRGRMRTGCALVDIWDRLDAAGNDGALSSSAEQIAGYYQGRKRAPQACERLAAGDTEGLFRIVFQNQEYSMLLIT